MNRPQHGFNQYTDGPNAPARKALVRVGYSDIDKRHKPQDVGAATKHAGKAALTGVKPAGVDSTRVWESAVGLVGDAPVNSLPTSRGGRVLWAAKESLGEEGVDEARRKALESLPKDDPGRRASEAAFPLDSVPGEESGDLEGTVAHVQPEGPDDLSDVTRRAKGVIVGRPGSWVMQEIARLEAEQTQQRQ